MQNLPCKTPQLLLPAGSMDMLRAAVYGGADAVYLGLGDFSARAKAQNFDGTQLKEAVDFAHLYGVKVYVALNTLVKNSEIEEILRAARTAYSANADALILQSAHFAAEITQRFEGISLHASTQMGIHSIRGAQQAKQLGFSRVILSRETPLEDIESIVKHADIEVEVFIHGAQCVSFSGGCYMSSFINSNSGNRGRCLQPCRLAYGGKQAPTGGDYKLSLADIHMGEHITHLRNVGVCSFKVEGRMRSPAYCAAAARYYRALLEGKTPDRQLKNALQASYNRGFTRGHCFGDIDITAHNTPGNTGRFLAVMQPLGISHISGRSAGKSAAHLDAKGITQQHKTKAPMYERAFEVKCEHVPHIRDGFKVLSPTGKQVGSAVYRGERTQKGFIFYSTSARPGDRLHLTKSFELSQWALEPKTIPVSVSFYARAGSVSQLTMRSENRQATVYGEQAGQIAQNSTRLEESYHKAVTRLGDTVFCADSVSIDAQGAFVPISEVNQMRRNCALALREDIISRFAGGLQKHMEHKTPQNTKAEHDDCALQNTEYSSCAVQDITDGDCAKKDINHNPAALHGNIIRVDDIQLRQTKQHPTGLELTYKNKVRIAAIVDDAEFEAAKHIDSFIYKPQTYSIEAALRFKKSLKNTDAYLYLPPIMTIKGEALAQQIIKSSQMDGIYANSLAAVKMATDMGLKLFAGMGLNIFNHFEAEYYGARGAYCYSKELSMGEIDGFADKNGYVFVYGDIVVMTLSHCPHRSMSQKKCTDCHSPDSTLTDKSGREFAAKRILLDKCRFELYNSAVLNAVGTAISPTGRYIVNLCNRSATQKTQVVDSIISGSVFDGGEQYTRGHLYRGVL